MKKMMRTWSAGLLLLLVACDKNDPNPGPQEPTTQNNLVDSAVIDAGNYAAFTYNAAGKMIHLVQQWSSTQPGGNLRVDINYVYSNAGVLERMQANGGHTNYFNTGTRLDSMDIFSMQQFVGREYFTINANKQVTRIRFVPADPFDDDPIEVIRDYSYDARGNVTEIASRFLYPGSTNYITEERIVYEQYDDGRNPDVFDTTYPQFVFWKNNPRRRKTFNKQNEVTQVQDYAITYLNGSEWPMQKSTLTTAGGVTSPAVVTYYKYK